MNDTLNYRPQSLFDTFTIYCCTYLGKNAIKFYCSFSQLLEGKHWNT